MLFKKDFDPKDAYLEDHIRELRNRLFTSLVAFVIFFVIGVAMGDRLTNLISAVGKDAGFVLIYIAPQEIIVQQLKVAALIAFVLDFPLIFYEIMSFIAPAFEKKMAVWKIAIYFIAACMMFVIGSVFASKVLVPFAFSYFKESGDALGLTGQISYESYISFLTSIIGAVAISFEFPILCILLCSIGIVTADGLTKARPFIIVFMFFVGAVITPPDIFTQCMVALPMCVLFELGIIVCKIINRPKKESIVTA